MTSPNHTQAHDTDLDALHALNSIQPPAGMQERIAEHIRQHQLLFPSRGLRRYTNELWVGASIAAVAAAVIVCLFALQAHRADSPSVAINMPSHTDVVPVPPSTNTQSAAAPPRKILHVSRVKLATAATLIPHTPPPQPLTAQERLLIALANTPSLAAGMAHTQAISEHGLGANALFELDHEDLQPMSSESRLSQPLPQNLP